jgi:hypothetical protein
MAGATLTFVTNIADSLVKVLWGVAVGAAAHLLLTAAARRLSRQNVQLRSRALVSVMEKRDP